MPNFLIKAAHLCAASFALFLLSGCHSSHSSQFSASAQAFPVGVQPFDNYLNEVERYLLEHRAFITDNKVQEMSMNMPFECGTQYRNIGVLLVHGLGDSPYFFSDVANAMCNEGIHVRTILLPGHGSKPGDMLNVSYQQWQAETNHHIRLFSEEVDNLYIGGFSTGANLTTIASFTMAEEIEIKGLMHFSPAFKSRFFVSRLAPYIDSLFPWPNVEEEDNPSRYNSTAMPGFAAYQESVNVLQDLFSQTELAKRTLNLPVLMVVAEKDSVVDTLKVAAQFRDNFTHPHKCLLWQGEDTPDVPENTLIMQTMNVPEQRISAASHMSTLFSDKNPLYGTASDFRICDNGQGNEAEARCKAGEEVWYGPWGFKPDKTDETVAYSKHEKVYARLTYNPYFGRMVDQLLAFTGKAKVKAFCKTY
ncbi:lipoprotein [Alteromonas macleodii str. 'Black Sea 11']|uniref:alpha/beta hydrolase n=1 Tax=Alteromonas abrolhosensis TaxID=1892904 RepID=UPI000286EE74|nr:alpha/beta fold hydrolase [Alteromonas abrolhosensis]AFT77775.1 lipoprotein [Alteromonas macleodii str. 'Black Sea 11']NKW88154.1 alpha/beta fold hydrolase [Alteromonadaceae bacterium A_SAG4]NKX04544.1 alpha/beta fold hydrolase [Alteromonadaceae bacterium A_SAG6]NKX34731.1 alpha/beta fold hydrolase [Alteromonadaceae bacterium A_SAG3]|tara:strand:- start:5934 stop:7190 length:1257 start_codon:yes stop_codon:yes gene_type:complete